MAPGGKADAALEKGAKETQDKFMAAQLAESAALAAIEASENHIKDAEAEVSHIADAKTRNGEALAAAAAAAAAAKEAQAKAAAELAAVKQTLLKGAARPLALAHQQCLVEAFPRPRIAQAHEPTIGRLMRREMRWQQSPRATASQHIENGVRHLA